MVVLVAGTRQTCQRFFKFFKLTSWAWDNAMNKAG
jgi:hypothetical protein